MSVHELRTWPIYFQPVLDGQKTFEKRIWDRDYKVGDTLVLKEWDPKTQEYTGRELDAVVTYILDGELALDKIWCHMSFKKVVR